MAGNLASQRDQASAQTPAQTTVLNTELQNSPLTQAAEQAKIVFEISKWILGLTSAILMLTIGFPSQLLGSTLLAHSLMATGWFFYLVSVLFGVRTLFILMGRKDRGVRNWLLGQLWTFTVGTISIGISAIGSLLCFWPFCR